MSVFLEIVLFQRTRLTNVYVFEYKKIPHENYSVSFITSNWFWTISLFPAIIKTSDVKYHDRNSFRSQNGKRERLIYRWQSKEHPTNTGRHEVPGDVTRSQNTTGSELARVCFCQYLFLDLKPRFFSLQRSVDPACNLYCHQPQSYVHTCQF